MYKKNFIVLNLIGIFFSLSATKNYFPCAIAMPVFEETIYLENRHGKQIKETFKIGPYDSVVFQWQEKGTHGNKCNNPAVLEKHLHIIKYRLRGMQESTDGDKATAPDSLQELWALVGASLLREAGMSNYVSSTSYGNALADAYAAQDGWFAKNHNARSVALSRLLFKATQYLRSNYGSQVRCGLGGKCKVISAKDLDSMGYGVDASGFGSVGPDDGKSYVRLENKIN